MKCEVPLQKCQALENSELAGATWGTFEDEPETIEVCKKLVRVVNNWLFFSVIEMRALARASSVFSTLTGVDGVGIARIGLREVLCKQKVIASFKLETGYASSGLLATV